MIALWSHTSVERVAVLGMRLHGLLGHSGG